MIGGAGWQTGQGDSWMERESPQLLPCRLRRNAWQKATKPSAWLDGRRRVPRVFVVTMTALMVSVSALQAQGLVQGVEQGSQAGRRAAGPVGGVLGGAIGGVVGVVGGVLGAGRQVAPAQTSAPPPEQTAAPKQTKSAAKASKAQGNEKNSAAAGAKTSPTQLAAINPADLSPEQIIASVDGNVARLKAELKLSVEQEKNWAAFNTAMHNLGLNGAERVKLRAARAQRDPPDDIVDQMRNEAQFLADRAQDQRVVADAVDPLFLSLDDKQKAIFIAEMVRLSRERGLD
jgi:hypothetical protein